MFATACSSILDDTPVDPSTPVSAEGTATNDPARDCIRFTGDHSAHIDTGAVAGDALFLAGETFLCASDVVIVGEGDLNQIAAASQLAAAMSGPLLFPEPRLAAELGRLKPDRVHLVGSVQVNVPDNAETVNHDISSATTLAGERLGVSPERSLPPTPTSATIVEPVLAMEDADRVVVPPPEPTSSTVAPEQPEVSAGEIVTGLATPTSASSLWLVDASNPTTVLLAAAVGRSIGAEVVALDGGDLLGYPEVTVPMEGHGPATMRYVGGIPEASDWELAVLTNGQQVPGGGFFILPEDDLRRYVAYYGHPGTSDLGVLGEQGPAETRSLMQNFVDAYAGDGSQVVPTFEIIVSVASANAGEDGDYSTEWPPDSFDDWISYARENDMYVVLDLQSGREDFLSQAILYEELLKLPFVGLALDPEWRLANTQVHLEQTGTVDAAEINEVVEWLGNLVRDKGLPQKLLLLHQFKTSMITNRNMIDLRPELQVIVQMDGDGAEADKNRTWEILHEGSDSERYAWGWKNFFDEDEPGPPSPDSTMGKVPSPVYVSYQ